MSAEDDLVDYDEEAEVQVNDNKDSGKDIKK